MVDRNKVSRQWRHVREVNAIGTITVAVDRITRQVRGARVNTRVVLCAIPVVNGDAVAIHVRVRDDRDGGRRKQRRAHDITDDPGGERCSLKRHIVDGRGHWGLDGERCVAIRVCRDTPRHGCRRRSNAYTISPKEGKAGSLLYAAHAIGDADGLKRRRIGDLKRRGPSKHHIVYVEVE